MRNSQFAIQPEQPKLLTSQCFQISKHPRQASAPTKASGNLARNIAGTFGKPHVAQASSRYMQKAHPDLEATLPSKHLRHRPFCGPQSPPRRPSSLANNPLHPPVQSAISTYCHQPSDEAGLFGAQVTCRPFVTIVACDLQ